MCFWNTGIWSCGGRGISDLREHSALGFLEQGLLQGSQHILRAEARSELTHFCYFWRLLLLGGLNIHRVLRSIEWWSRSGSEYLYSEPAHYFRVGRWYGALALP
jgi:hypothetical protein